MDGDPVDAQTQQGVELPQGATALDMQLGALDIKGKLALIRPSPQTTQVQRDFIASSLGNVLREAGAVAVVVLSPDSDIGVTDVVGKFIVVTSGETWWTMAACADVVRRLQKVVMPVGAVGVGVLQPGCTLAALSDADLAVMGLRRIALDDHG